VNLHVALRIRLAGLPTGALCWNTGFHEPKIFVPESGQALAQFSLGFEQAAEIADRAWGIAVLDHSKM
jgi:hypothetical protein